MELNISLNTFFLKKIQSRREKNAVTYKRKSITVTIDHSAETLQARRKRCDIFKVLREKFPTYPSEVNEN